MKTPKRIKQLERMATNMVADGKSPNLFFVSIQGVIVTVTRNFKLAYNQWKSLTGLERTLEDRKWGTICDAYCPTVSPKLVIVDDSEQFKKEYLTHERTR